VSSWNVCTSSSLSLEANRRLAGGNAASVIGFTATSGSLFRQGAYDLESLSLVDFSANCTTTYALTLTSSTNVYLRWVIVNGFALTYNSGAS